MGCLSCCQPLVRQETIDASTPPVTYTRQRVNRKDNISGEVKCCLTGSEKQRDNSLGAKRASASSHTQAINCQDYTCHQLLPRLMGKWLKLTPLRRQTSALTGGSSPNQGVLIKGQLQMVSVFKKGVNRNVLIKTVPKKSIRHIFSRSQSAIICFKSYVGPLRIPPWKGFPQKGTFLFSSGLRNRRHRWTDIGLFVPVNWIHLSRLTFHLHCQCQCPVLIAVRIVAQSFT